MHHSLDQRIKLFLGSRTRLNRALKSHGFHERARLDSAIPQIADLSPERLNETLATVRALEKILLSAESEQHDLLQTDKMLELTFNDLLLTYSKDFTSTLGPDDVVDGYNLDNLQIFRNFRFMQICGYDVHDILLHEWPMLFERSQLVTSQIMDKVKEVLTTGRTVSLEDVPVHYMKERLSQDRQIFKVRFKHLGPIFASAGNPAGFLASSEAELIDECPTDHKVRFI